MPQRPPARIHNLQPFSAGRIAFIFFQRNVFFLSFEKKTVAMSSRRDRQPSGSRSRSSGERGNRTREAPDASVDYADECRRKVDCEDAPAEDIGFQNLELKCSKLISILSKCTFLKIN